jgi:hypothetical protein
MEIKVDRGDWKRELADPKKAEDAAKVADRFSIVAPRGVVELAEVPATWGYIEASGGVEEVTEEPPMWDGGDPVKVTRMVGRKLRTVRAAPLLRPAEECRGPISRGLLVTMLRAAGAVPDAVAPSQKVIDVAVAAAEAKLHATYRDDLERAREDLRVDGAVQGGSGTSGRDFRSHDRGSACAGVSVTGQPEDITPRGIENAIRDCAVRIGNGVRVCADRYAAFLAADHACDLATARAYVACSDRPAHERRYLAEIATEMERVARDVADAAYRHAERQAKALDAELRAWQSVGASLRVQYGVAGRGEV